MCYNQVVSLLRRQRISGCAWLRSWAFSAYKGGLGMSKFIEEILIDEFRNEAKPMAPIMIEKYKNFDYESIDDFNMNQLFRDILYTQYLSSIGEEVVKRLIIKKHKTKRNVKILREVNESSSLFHEALKSMIQVYYQLSPEDNIEDAIKTLNKELDNTHDALVERAKSIDPYDVEWQPLDLPHDK